MRLGATLANNSFLKRGSNGLSFSCICEGQINRSRKGGHMSLKHKVTIKVAKSGGKGQVIEISRKTIRSKMLDMLFGKGKPASNNTRPQLKR